MHRVATGPEGSPLATGVCGSGLETAVPVDRGDRWSPTGDETGRPLPGKNIAVDSGIAGMASYEPTAESLDCNELPDWCHDTNWRFSFTKYFNGQKSYTMVHQQIVLALTRALAF